MAQRRNDNDLPFEGVNQQAATRPQKGLYLDAAPQDQPEGTYRFALNAEASTSDGNQGSRARERGNYEVWALPSGYRYVGHEPCGDDVFVFSVNPTLGVSEVGVVDRADRYTTIIRSACLGFDLCHRIAATCRVRRGCERVLYWTDRLNPVRAVNVDRLELYLEAGETQSTANTSTTGWKCDAMRMFPVCQWPCVELVSVPSSGGNMIVGAYAFALRYLDEAGNATSWFPVSRPVAINDEALVAGFFSIGGPYYASDGAPSGTVSNKSIVLRFTNLDQEFSSYEVAVVRAVEGVGEYVDAFAVGIFPIDGPASTFTFTGVNAAQGHTPLSTDEVLTPTAVYSTARAVAQNQNRLVLSNLTEPTTNWAAFQQAANNICVEYVTTRRSATDPNGGAPKGGEYYFDLGSLMRDEVYALAVRPTFKDKRPAPAFHIPGRSKDSWCGAALATGPDPNGAYHNRPPADVAGGTGWDSTAMQSMLTAGVGEPADDFHIRENTGRASTDIERWEVYNTAIRQSAPEDTAGGVWHRGVPAYWESTLRYPDDLDCNGDRVYPEGFIRHHKMPDATLEPVHSQGASGEHYTYPLGVVLSNVVMPADYLDQLDGWEVLVAKRTPDTESVFDKGLVFFPQLTEGASSVQGYRNDEWLFQRYPVNANIPFGADATPNCESDGAVLSAFVGDTVPTISPRAAFERLDFPVTHLKLEHKLAGTFVTCKYINNASNLIWHGAGTFNDYSLPSPAAGAVTSQTNRAITGKAYVDYNTELRGVLAKDIVNCTQQVQLWLDLEDPLDALTGIAEWTGSDVEAAPESEVYYGAYKRYLPAQYGQLYNLTYVPLAGCRLAPAATTAQVFGGDVFIQRMFTNKDLNFKRADGSRIRTTYSFFTESAINQEYRHEGSDLLSDGTAVACQSYYPKSYGTNVCDWLDNRESALLDAEDVTIACENYYRLNKDFNVLLPATEVAPLPRAYRWCDDCEGKYPHRNAYSLQAFDNDATDRMRQFLVNNFRDLPGHRGEITGLFVYSDILYAHTQRSLWRLFTGQQELQTNEGVTFLGTGAFFGQEPVEVVSTAQGYAGSDSQWATNVSEWGVLFVEQRYGRVFLMQKQVSEISADGVFHWFKKEGPLQWCAAFKRLTGLDYSCCDQPQSPVGVGYVTAYDSRMRRYLVTKKDYRPTALLEDNFLGVFSGAVTYPEGAIVWRPSAARFERRVLEEPEVYVWEPIVFWDPQYFENVSWTISYDTASKAWVGWHSYLPSAYVDTPDRVYSTVVPTVVAGTAQSFWRHDSDSQFSTYYGVGYPHTIELVTRAPRTIDSWIYGALQWHSLAQRYEFAEGTLIDSGDVTFNRLLVYNDYQCSGEVRLVYRRRDTGLRDWLQETTEGAPGEALVTRVQRDWRVHQFRDLVTNRNIPLFTRSWNVPEYRNGYYIDKVVNSAALDLNKPWHDQEQFKDKYLIVRLTIDNNHDYRLVTSFVTELVTYSPR